VKEFKFESEDNLVTLVYEKIKKSLEEEGFEKVFSSTSMEAESITEFKKGGEIYSIEIKDISPTHSEVRITGTEPEKIFLRALKKFMSEELLELLRKVDFMKAKKLEEFLIDL